uniref:Uncharacterized protein n=1 Tax=Anopheles quadriannulatus TaxID=34691 RepID=A0A182XII1_ANOQN
MNVTGRTESSSISRTSNFNASSHDELCSTDCLVSTLIISHGKCILASSVTRRYSKGSCTCPINGITSSNKLGYASAANRSHSFDPYSASVDCTGPGRHSSNRANFSFTASRSIARLIVRLSPWSDCRGNLLIHSSSSLYRRRSDGFSRVDPMHLSLALD